MLERARAWSAVWRPVPTISTRSDPRCSAGLTGAIWRIEPSPKYSRCTFTAGKMNGSAAAALVALPALEPAAALEERDALARGIAGRRDAHRVERARVDVPLDALEREGLLEHFPERRVVEQRNRVVARDQHHRREPARAAFHDARGVGAVDVVAMHVLPRLEQVRHRAREVVGEHRERRRLDRAPRGAAHDR